MGFADFYFTRFKTYNRHIPEDPVPEDLQIIVVIPALREYRLFQTIECLANNDFHGRAEVIVVFNSQEKEDKGIVQLHRRQADLLPGYSTENVRFIPIVETDLPTRIAGAGLARKLGMDIALMRFNKIDNDQGIIASLDADTLCDGNYLSTLVDSFARHPAAPGATIAFEHPVEGDEFPAEVYSAIVLYELYLRYYVEALRYVGFPYAYHTVGSAFAVRAWAYARQGGMGLQQAGEDFYFLHKIIPLGHFFEIKNTRVYPSPRMSTRVPFGTGPVIRRIVADHMNDYPVYPLQCFFNLKPIFNRVNQLFEKDVHRELTGCVRQFLHENDFDIALENMRANSASAFTFEKRFYSWFDAFRVVKFLNFCADHFFPRRPVTSQAKLLLEKKDIKFVGNNLELLYTYRQIQN